jgi:hypothetical protein
MAPLAMISRSDFNISPLGTTPMPAGYSGTPLARKLGVKAGLDVFALGMPSSVRAEIETEAKPRWVKAPRQGLAAAHVFATEAAKLRAQLERLRPLLAADGQVWVSWPKKAAKVETDITEGHDPRDCAAHGLCGCEGLRRR